MATRKFLSNDGSRGTQDDTQIFQHNVTGNFTADSTAQLLFVMPAGMSGRIVAAYLRHGENGADGTDPLSNELDVLIGGVSAFSTKPVLDKTAGTGAKNTFSAATGVTVGVINTAANTVAAGAAVTVTLNITRTTPETEIANVTAIVVVEFEADVV